MVITTFELKFYQFNTYIEYTESEFEICLQTVVFKLNSVSRV